MALDLFAPARRFHCSGARACRGLTWPVRAGPAGRGGGEEERGSQGRAEGGRGRKRSNQPVPPLLLRPPLPVGPPDLPPNSASPRRRPECEAAVPWLLALQTHAPPLEAAPRGFCCGACGVARLAEGVPEERAAFQNQKQSVEELVRRRLDQLHTVAPPLPIRQRHPAQVPKE